MISGLRNLRQQWFAPADPRGLASLRIAFFALCSWYYLPHDFTIWGELPASFRRELYLFELLRLNIAGPRTLTVLETIWKASLLTSAAGLATRISLVVAFLLSLYMLGIPNHFGKIGHGDGVLVIAMGVLMLSHCDRRWTLDALIRARLGARRPDPLPSGEYRWPIALLRLLSAIVFLAAGITKLKTSGLEWVFSENLRNVLLQHHVHSRPKVDWGLWIADRPWRYQSLAAFTLSVELLFPLSLFSLWARRVLVPSMFLIQVGIAVVMGVVFTQFMFIYLFWLPVIAVFRAGRPAAAGGAAVRP